MAELIRRPRERAIAALAARQHEVIARHQLVGLGLTARAIQYRLSVGRLHVIHRCVYAVGRNLGARGRWMAAVLACGQDAVLSHRSAGRLWGRTLVDLAEVMDPGALEGAFEAGERLELHSICHLLAVAA
jgi:hypothetical protein